MTLETDLYKSFKVLYVDDEVQSLKYFAKYFGDKFEIATAETADEAWDKITSSKGDFSLVISDQRMPGKQGVDFLAEVRRECPKIVRILTTAYADLQSAVDAVNKGYIYRYVVKPWNLPELEMVLKQSFDHYRLLQERDRLIYEKLSVNQRFLITDRVHCLGLVAAAHSTTWGAEGGALVAFIKGIPSELEEACKSFATKAANNILSGSSMMQRDQRIPLLQLARDVSMAMNELCLTDKEEISVSRCLRILPLVILSWRFD